MYCGPKIAPCVRLTHGSAQTNWPGDETAASQAAALATALFHTEIARKLANAGDTYKARVQCVWVPVVAPFCFSPASAMQTAAHTPVPCDIGALLALAAWHGGGGASAGAGSSGDVVAAEQTVRSPIEQVCTTCCAT